MRTIGVLQLLFAVALTSAKPVLYHLEARSGPLGHRFAGWQLEVLQILNRADLEHLERFSRIVVPDAWTTDVLSYSPLPLRYAAADPVAKLLVVHQPWQAFGAYESGRLVRWGPVSSGRKAMQTPTGLFHLNWKSTGRRSTVDPEWFMPWYFNFGNAEGLSFHQYALPGRPASHACVRLLGADARWLFDWGDEWTLDGSRRHILQPGTPVFIVGIYDFTAPAPWQSPERLRVPIELPAVDIAATAATDAHETGASRSRGVSSRK
jgi:hypothetical protein